MRTNCGSGVAVFVCIFFLSPLLPVAAQTSPPAVTADDVARLKSECDASKFQSCSALGGMYLHGVPAVPRTDQPLAEALFKKACDGGFAEGCSRLGDVYVTGRGPKPDFAQAAHMYKQACDGGFAEGCSHLGDRFRAGQGVAPDLGQAVQLYKKACDGGFAQGCHNLAQMYEMGQSVTKDMNRAEALYQMGCKSKFTESCQVLSRIATYNETNPAKRLALYQEACDGGEPGACTAVGVKYEYGEGVARDTARAYALYKKACELHDTSGCVRVKQLAPEENARVERDRLRGLCDQQDSRSCMSLGLQLEQKALRETREGYNRGAGSGPDFGQIAQLFKQACDGGVAEGCVRLGQMHESGRGVSLDHERAVALYRTACKSKAVSGCTALLSSNKDKDPAKYVALLQESCDGDYAAACTLLGQKYESGQDVARDPVRALALDTKACELHDSTGCMFAKRITENEKVTADQNRLQALCDQKDFRSCMEVGSQLEKSGNKDRSALKSLYQKACDEGYSESCHRLAKVYGESWYDVPPDEARAVALYTRACDGGYPQSCSQLASYYKEGRGGLPQDFDKAVALYKQACTLKLADACAKVEQTQKEGVEFEQGQVERAKLKAECGQNDYSACGMLGWKYLKVIGDKDGAALLQRACDGGDDYSCMNLGWLNEKGRGVPKDLDKAAMLYQKTCNARAPGNSLDLACSHLEELAQTYDYGTGVTPDKQKAVDLYQFTCAAGQRKSCDRLLALGYFPPGIYPKTIVAAAQRCKQGGPGPLSASAQASCSLVEMFSSMKSMCERGRAHACVAIADEATKEDDYQAAAIYYKWACSFGDRKSCGRAAEYKKKN